MSCLKQDKNLKLSLERRILIFVLGFFDNILFGGAIFGWPQLVYVLKVDGVNGHLCDGDIGYSKESADTAINSSVVSKHRIFMGMDFTNATLCTKYGQSSFAFEHATTSQCPEQDERFALLHTISVVCYGTPAIVIGYLLHHAGLRITRLIGGAFIAVSFICLALTTPEEPNWLFPAAILLSVGGNQVRMCGLQFGDLFPHNRSTTITVLTGVYAGSASLFYLFYIAQNNGFPKVYLCALLGGIAFGSALCSFVMPRHHIPNEEERKEFLETEIPTYSIPLWTTFRSLSSLLVTYWFFVILFCVNIYQQFYNIWVTASTCTQEGAGLFSSLYSFSNLVSIFCAPVGGLFMDYLVRKAKRKNVDDPVEFRTKEIQANFWPLFLTTVFTLIMHSCLLFFTPTSIIVSLLCMIIVRPCVVAISAAYIRIRFPTEHFNRLLGIIGTASSLLMYLQYPIFQLAQAKYYAAHALVISLATLSLLNPLHILWTPYIRKCVRKRDRLLGDEPTKMPT